MKKPTRNTPVKKIRAFVQKGDFPGAQCIAMFGRPLSPVENYLRDFYETIKLFDATQRREIRLLPVSREKSEAEYLVALKSATGIMRAKQSELEKIIVSAIKKFDVKMMMKFAEAVRFFKDKPFPYYQDSTRVMLLALKSALDSRGMHITVRQLANGLAKRSGNKIETSADGFSALRRICLEIGFPLAPSRKIRKK